TTLAGELLYYAPVWFPDWLSYRNYTIWATFNLLFCLVLLGRVLDAWHRHTMLPVRLGAALVLLGALTLIAAPTVGTPQQEPRKDDQITEEWLHHWEERLRGLAPEAPVVFVAASGGGSRAAVFTALVLEALANAEVEVRDESGSKRPLKLAQQLVLVS